MEAAAASKHLFFLTLSLFDGFSCEESKTVCLSSDSDSPSLASSWSLPVSGSDNSVSACSASSSIQRNIISQKKIDKEEGHG